MNIPTDDSKRFAITFLEAEITEMNRDRRSYLKTMHYVSDPEKLKSVCERLEKDIERLQSVVDYLSEGLV